MNNLIEYIQDRLDIKNVGPQIIEKVPSLVEDAIFELQIDQVIPAKVWQFTAIDEKQIKYKEDGEVWYNYFKLPEDFGQLETFFVDDPNENTDPVKRIPYLYVPYSEYMDTFRTTDSKKYFTVTDIDVEGESQTALIVNPFPENDKMVKIEYYPSGNDIDISDIDRKYWKQILREIEGEIGLRSQESVINERSLQISRSKHKEGQNPTNRTMRSTKPKFFRGKGTI